MFSKFPSKVRNPYHVNAYRPITGVCVGVSQLTRSYPEELKSERDFRMAHPPSLGNFLSPPNSRSLRSLEFSAPPP
jgi:hypothetical protein